MSRDHRKLKAFDAADELVMITYLLTRHFPKDEWYGLRGQMRRAALSVASNIVEGCARSSEHEYVNFLNIAFGSARELGYQVSVAKRLEYLSETEANLLTSQQESVVKMLSGLIAALRR